MIRLIKNWWLNRKIEKEWLEWGKRNPEQVARMKKVIKEVEFPTPKKYREEVNNELRVPTNKKTIEN